MSVTMRRVTGREAATRRACSNYHFQKQNKQKSTTNIPDETVLGEIKLGALRVTRHDTTPPPLPASRNDMSHKVEEVEHEAADGAAVPAAEPTHATWTGKWRGVSPADPDAAYQVRGRGHGRVVWWRFEPLTSHGACGPLDTLPVFVQVAVL